MKVGKYCPYDVVEGAEPFMHPTSMPYILKVFQAPSTVVMWIGIWLHTHTVTTTDRSPFPPQIWESWSKILVKN